MKYKKKQLKVMAIFIVTVLVILFSNKINIKNLRANIDANQNKFRNGDVYVKKIFILFFIIKTEGHLSPSTTKLQIKTV